MRYAFAWDPVKAASNLARHGVTFDDAMGVFRDPLHLSRLDDNHGVAEECWVTLGAKVKGKHVFVAHTYAEDDADRAEDQRL